MAKQVEIRWLEKPDDNDYSAAESYLRLLYDEPSAASYVKRLRQLAIVEFKAKDLLRASGLPLLGVSDSHVRKDRDKIRARKRLGPLLLVRAVDHGKVNIADGYHRLCAVCSLDADALIPCKIV